MIQDILKVLNTSYEVIDRKLSLFVGKINTNGFAVLREKDC